ADLPTSEDMKPVGRGGQNCTPKHSNRISRPAAELCAWCFQLGAWRVDRFGSDSAVAATLAARPVHPRKRTICCNAHVVSVGPIPEVVAPARLATLALPHSRKFGNSVCGAGTSSRETFTDFG